ncbi:kynurenine formamidase [Spinactinospora alkalitolerans]|uniref:Kynurenine formamidase n=1 Tax=Spinactinospora alkalitolerans TaxID=687207 RepID=A0A852TSK5_9ACTN|nr:cyclase family protein [Spinactinospora alkalitolerans]NYE46515.1 kynurenine formamidase [Spinactinospora alkalitolerans]
MRISRIIDLSRSIGPGTQVYPGDPVPRLSPAATVAEDGYNLLHVSMGSQSGTHADAPRHFFDGGARIDELPLELFTGPAVVVEAAGRTDRSPITRADLEPWDPEFGPGAVVLLRTGWSRHYGTRRYFAHPHLTGEAARHLVDAGVRTIGIDAPNPDPTPDEDHPSQAWPVHRAVLGAGGVIIENLCGLERIDFPAPLFSALPIALEGADGAPVRAVAMRME